MTNEEKIQLMLSCEKIILVRALAGCLMLFGAYLGYKPEYWLVYLAVYGFGCYNVYLGLHGSFILSELRKIPEKVEIDFSDNGKPTFTYNSSDA